LKRTLRCIFFDLDDTLYPRSSGLMQAIGDRINRYMIERLDIKPAEVSTIRDSYLKKFGTTLNALRRYYDVDPDEYLNFVHDIPIGRHLQYDPELDQMLERLKPSKAIFTNADAKHARRVLTRLGILRHFEFIIDIHMVDFCNKPDRRAYSKALGFASVQAEDCILVEDSMANVLAAREFGMTTVMVGEGLHSQGAHFHIERITDLEDLLNRL
jgi:putative hydrolase of the HAD superfamily